MKESDRKRQTNSPPMMKYLKKKPKARINSILKWIIQEKFSEIQKTLSFLYIEKANNIPRKF